MKLFNRAVLIAAACVAVPAPIAAQAAKKPTVASVNADLQAAKVNLQAQIDALRAAPTPAPSPTPTPTPTASGWVACAKEYGTCQLPRDVTRVRYGAGARWVEKTVPAGTRIACGSATFGDPAVGEAKTCERGAGAVDTVIAVRPKIGTNLDGNGLSYYGSQFPFIDRARTLATNSWSVTDLNWQGLPAGSIRINPATGLPGEQAKNVQFVNTLFNIEPVSWSVPHRYVISWKGSAKVEIGFKAAKNVQTTANSYAFDYVGDVVQAQIIIRGLTDKDPLTDLHIVRADQQAAFAAGQIFNPAFLAKVSQWSVLRFMDWGAVNGSQVVQFEELPTMAQPSWGDGRGVPLQVMVDLSNAAGADMWYCIPAHASDDFIRRVLTYVRDHLDPKLRLHLEYSNETWNYGFEQFRYSAEQGKTLGQQRGSAKDLGASEWYGFRSAQIAALTDAVFGSASRTRVKNVLGAHTYWGGYEEGYWTGIDLANLGAPSDLFEEYAITTYFGHSFGGGSDADKAKVLDWARSGAAGLDAAFAELTTGGQLSGISSLAALRQALAYHGAVARNFGFALVAYEGGAHLTAGGYGNEADQATFVDFMRRILNDPRAGALIAGSIDALGDSGGTLLAAFADVGSVTKYGAWGNLDNIYQAGSPRYDAYVAAQRSAGK